MSREIKFRVYDKENKKMYLQEAITKIDVVAKEIGILNYICLDSLVDIQTEKTRFFDDVEIMQYTGLKDKNGKEIYEGDVVRLVYFNDKRKKEVAEVVFLKHQASFGIIDRDLNEYPLYLNTSKQIEVIGNIYENPEIL